MTPADLQAWRAHNDISQDALAKALGVHPMTISKWERGTTKIPPLLQWALYGLMADQIAGRSREITSGGN